jgi:hypothetical protein
MPKIASAVVLAAAAAVLVSGCGSRHGRPAAASSLASNPVMKADEAREQAMLDKCLSQGTVITANGRKRFYHCADGGESAAKFEACATAQLKATSLLSKSGRDAWMTAIAQKCVVTP